MITLFRKLILVAVILFALLFALPCGIAFAGPEPCLQSPVPLAEQTPVPADSGLKVVGAGTAVQTGLFVGDDPQFPFVLQFEQDGQQPGTCSVRGLGRLVLSAENPTPVMAEFRAFGRTENGITGLRGALRFLPDGQDLLKARLIPWYGQYDPAGGGWQLMVSPEHVLTTSRPGAVAVKGKAKPANQPVVAAKDMWDAAFAADDKLRNSDAATINQAAAVNRLHTDAQVAIDRGVDGLLTGYLQAVTSLHQVAGQIGQAAAQRLGGGKDSVPPMSAADARDYLDNASIVLAGMFGSPDNLASLNDVLSPVPGVVDTGPAKPPRITAVTPPPLLPPADPDIGRSFDDVMAELWVRGLVDNRPEALNPISYTLVPAPDAAHAGQVVRVRRDSSGRIIEIVSYGSGPDGPNVAQGGAGTTAVGSTSVGPTNPTGGNVASTGGAGSGARGGSGSPPNLPPAADSGVPPAAPPAIVDAPPVSPGRIEAHAATRDFVRNRDGTAAGTSGERYVDGVTVIVSEDGGTSPDRGDSQAAVSVPNLIGMTEEQAAATLIRLGLGQKNSVQVSAELRIVETPGVVFKQEPAAGTSVPPKTVVKYTSYFDGGPLGQGGYDPDREFIDQARTALAINRARAALNRAAAGDVSGIHVLAKGPKGTDADHQHDVASDSKPNDRKPHPIEGKWHGSSENVGTQMTVTVSGQSLRFVGTVTWSDGSEEFDLTATFSGSGNGPFAVVFPARNINGIAAPAYSGTMTCSPDGKTLSWESQGTNGTWQRVE